MTDNTFDNLFGFNNTENTTTQEDKNDTKIEEENTKTNDENVDSEQNKRENDKSESYVEEIDRLNKQLEKLRKQEADTKKWGNENREVYMRAKKKADELATKLYDEGVLFDEHYDSLKTLFDRTLDSSTESENQEIKQNEETPIMKTLKKIDDDFKEYKKWSTEEDIDSKYAAFFKSLELVTEKRLNDVREYLISETDPKQLMKYILENGTKAYDKFFKKVNEEGDAVTYVDKLIEKNKLLEKELADLKSELDDTETRVYNKSSKQTSSINKKSKFDELFGF